MKANSLAVPDARRKNPWKSQREFFALLKRDMTSCIAAICENTMIVCAGDRMLTRGAITSEPQASKIMSLTPSIIVMIAGDIEFQSETVEEIKAKYPFDAHPKKSLSVEQVAWGYRDVQVQRIRRKIKSEILEPRFLDEGAWQNSDPGLVGAIDSEIKALIDRVGSETIVAGVDHTGPHIWVVCSDAAPTCHDKEGFAAIGSGKYIAIPQLATLGQIPNMTLTATILHVFLAKKRSENALGIGEQTDLRRIDERGQSQSLVDGAESIIGLDDIVKEIETSQWICLSNGHARLIENLQKAAERRSGGQDGK